LLTYHQKKLENATHAFTVTPVLERQEVIAIGLGPAMPTVGTTYTRSNTSPTSIGG
jgi:hypothetical protein